MRLLSLLVLFIEHVLDMSDELGDFFLQSFQLSLFCVLALLLLYFFFPVLVITAALLDIRCIAVLSQNMVLGKVVDQ